MALRPHLSMRLPLSDLQECGLSAIVLVRLLMTKYSVVARRCRLSCGEY